MYVARFSSKISKQDLSALLWSYEDANDQGSRMLWRGRVESQTKTGPSKLICECETFQSHPIFKTKVGSNGKDGRERGSRKEGVGPLVIRAPNRLDIFGGAV